MRSNHCGLRYLLQKTMSTYKPTHSEEERSLHGLAQSQIHETTTHICRNVPRRIPRAQRPVRARPHDGTHRARASSPPETGGEETREAQAKAEAHSGSEEGQR